MRSVVVLLVSFVVLYTYRVDVLNFVAIPYAQTVDELNDLLIEGLRERVETGELKWEKYFVSDALEKLQWSREVEPTPTAFEAGGPFIAKVLACFWISLFIAAPILMWEMWMFVAAGLYKKERSVVYTYFPACMLLFLAGVAFGFMILTPAAIYYTQGDGLGYDDIPRKMSLTLYMQFLRSLTLAVGLVFQLPVIQYALSKMGIVEPRLYAKYRGHMAIVALILAAIITPPDPFTQVLLAGPAIVLWEVGYWVSRFACKNDGSADLDTTSGASA
jgi:Tat protein translocase TatC